MAGFLPTRRSGGERRGKSARWMRALVFCALGLGSPVRAEDVDVRIWVAWGGGAARRWAGEIRIDQPQAQPLVASCIREFEPVGLSPDEPGSMYVDGDAIVLTRGTPRTYDGVRFRVTAASTAEVSILLSGEGTAEADQRIQIPLARLLSESHTSPLDERGNRLLVRRDPGDELRVRFQRDSLVFETGEKFEFHVAPHLAAGVEPDDPLVCTARLCPARTETELWEETREVRTGRSGEPLETGPWTLAMPDQEGVYDLHLTLSKRRLPTRFAPTKDITERIVQVVVLSRQPPPATAAAWEVVAETQPQVDTGTAAGAAGSPGITAAGSTTRLWKSLPRLPHWKWLAGADSSGRETPIGNGLSRLLKAAGGEYVELSPGGWQAYPLPVAGTGQPHVVEVEYPNTREQTLGISVVEPNAAGMVTPIGLHSGVDVAPAVDANSSGTDRHRLIFWPRTNTPFLLVTNRRDDAPAVLGTLRVLSGPARLPAPAVADGEAGRLLALYFDRPLLAETFSASDALDAGSGRSLTDWVTFYQAGVRLVEYLKHSGQNGAMISVWHEGSAIYPSALLQPTPKHDSGVFFATGQDPVRKDIVELLLRLFEREGLTLVPALQFATPLPELEALRRRQTLPRSASGLELITADGQSWPELFAAERAVGPRYNPLSPSVQQAMQRVVLELARRYGAHRSFGGVAVQLGPNSYAQLPDVEWAQDDATLRQFMADEPQAADRLTGRERVSSAAFLAGDGRDRWLNWRAGQLAGFYRATAAELTQLAPQGKLYLAGAELLTDPQLESELRPTLPERTEIKPLLLRVGIDPLRYRDDDRVVLLRPSRWAPQQALPGQAVNLQLRSSAELDQLFGGALRIVGANGGGLRSGGWTGGLLYCEPQTFSLAAFQARGPFGADRTASWMLAQIAPSAAAARQGLIHSLATLDSQVLFQGGWTAVMGQEDAWRAVADVYRQLPSARFETVPSSRISIESPPVVVRRSSQADRTYFYAVNDSPWPVSVALTIEASPASEFRVLGSRACPPPVARDKTQVWTVALQPYDLAAAVVGAPNARIVDWQADVGSEVLVDLSTGIKDLLKRAKQLAAPQPLRVLGNPDFEIRPQGELLPGWDFSRTAGIETRIVAGQGRNGSNGLHLRSSSPVAWVRSNTFPAPATGRLSVWVWLRIDDPGRQPPLQLAVEGRLDGQPYYRPARVGAGDDRFGEPPPPLTTDWAPYLVRIDDLPARGLSDLRVALDLMGPGEVWIDDVQVFDLWFDKNERNELVKKFAVANLYLGQGEVVECHQVLRGYWAEFLRRYVPVEEPQLAELTGANNPRPEAEASAPKESASSPSWLKKMVPKAPKLPTWFR